MLEPFLFRPIETSEAEAILQFLFENVGHRPKKLTLDETASVVRYLKQLADTGRKCDSSTAERPEIPDAQELKTRSIVLALAQTIWGDLFQFGFFEPSSKATALNFLKHHRETYLANSNLETVLPLLEDFESRPATDELAIRPAFMSRSVQIQAKVSPSLQSDLSERVFAAYHLLKKIPKRAAVIAKALNRYRIARGKTKGTNVNDGDPWDELAVIERKNRFERLNLKFRTNMNRLKAAQIRRAFRDGLVEKWTIIFRQYQSLTNEKAEPPESARGLLAAVACAGWQF
jgi:hypothetical protein